MADPDTDEREANDRWPVDVPGMLEVGSVETPGVTDLTAEVESLLAGARPDPEEIEAALSGIDARALDDVDVSASTLSGSTPISPEDADAVVEAGGETVALTVEAGEETASVLLDAGDEALEVAVEDGGEVAAEVVAETLAAALDGV